MSFDIFLHAFSNGEIASFRAQTLKEAFGPDAEFGPDFCQVSFPDDSGGDIYGADKPEISHLMFNHFGGDSFFAGLLELARRTNGLIYWPSTPLSAVTTSQEALTHVNREFLDAFEITIVETVADFCIALGKA